MAARDQRTVLRLSRIGCGTAPAATRSSRVRRAIRSARQTSLAVKNRGRNEAGLTSTGETRLAKAVAPASARLARTFLLLRTCVRRGRNIRSQDKPCYNKFAPLKCKVSVVNRPRCRILLGSFHLSSNLGQDRRAGSLKQRHQLATATTDIHMLANAGRAGQAAFDVSTSRRYSGTWRWGQLWGHPAMLRGAEADRYSVSSRFWSP